MGILYQCQSMAEGMRQVHERDFVERSGEVKEPQSETLNWLPKDTEFVQPSFMNSWNSNVSHMDRLLTNLANAIRADDRSWFERSDLCRETNPAFLADELIKQVRQEWVANNLDKFPLGSVDVVSLAINIIKQKRGVWVTDNLEKFLQHGVDPAFLAQKLIEQGQVNAVARHFEKFPQGSIDIAFFVDRCFAQQQGYLVAENLEKFPQGSIDTAWLANQLIKQGQAIWVAENLEKFPKGSVDATFLADIFFKERRVDGVAKFIEKFFHRGVDTTFLANKFIEHGYVNWLAGILEKFPQGSVDFTFLAGILIASGRAHVVADNLEKFPQGSVDVHNLANELIKQGRLRWLVNNLGKFPVGSIDATSFADSLFLTGRSSWVGERLETFLQHGVDATFLAQKLIDHGEFRIVVDNLEKFPQGSVDVVALIRAPITIKPGDLGKFLQHGVDATFLINELFKHKQAYAVADNLEQFPEGSVDVAFLVNELFEQGAVLVAVKHFEKFLQYGVDAMFLVKKFMDHGVWDWVVNNLEKFPKEAITPEIRRNLPIQGSEALFQHRYRVVKTWLENMQDKHSSNGLRGMFDETIANRELSVLIRDKRLENANYLRDCMVMTGTTIDDSLSVLLETEMPYADVLPREIDKEEHVVADEVLKFYAETYFEQRINKIMSVRDGSYKMDVRDRVDLDTTKREINNNRKRLQNWLRQYLLKAVSSELSHQKSEDMVVPVSDSDVVIKEATREQILNFFDSASVRFSTSRWDSSYGGSSWSRIAKAGYVVWANDIQISVIVDYIFDLQHNTGAIFDKNKARVKQDKTDLNKVLDLKREGDLMDHLPDLSGICDQDLMNGIQARMRIIKRIEKKVGVGQ